MPAEKEEEEEESKHTAHNGSDARYQPEKMQQTIEAQSTRATYLNYHLWRANVTEKNSNEATINAIQLVKLARMVGIGDLRSYSKPIKYFFQ